MRRVAELGSLGNIELTKFNHQKIGNSYETKNRSLDSNGILRCAGVHLRDGRFEPQPKRMDYSVSLFSPDVLFLCRRRDIELAARDSGIAGAGCEAAREASWFT